MWTGKHTKRDTHAQNRENETKRLLAGMERARERETYASASRGLVDWRKAKRGAYPAQDRQTSTQRQRRTHAQNRENETKRLLTCMERDRVIHT